MTDFERMLGVLFESPPFLHAACWVPPVTVVVEEEGNELRSKGTSNPQSSMASLTWAAEMTEESNSTVACSCLRETTIWRIPGIAETTDVMALTHDIQVIPITGRTMVVDEDDVDKAVWEV